MSTQNQRLRAKRSFANGAFPSRSLGTSEDAQRKCRVMFIAGSEDRQVSPDTVKKAYTNFGRAGHPVEFCLIEGLGHQWALQHDVHEKMWRFLRRYRLP